MLFELPVIARAPIQLLLWCWIVLLPGLGLASMWLRGRRVRDVEAASLVLGFGLMAVPLAAYVYVLIAFVPMTLKILLVPSSAVNLLYLAFRFRGLRMITAPSSRWLWAGMGLVLAVAFLSYDAGHLSFTLQEWRTTANTDCFRSGVYQLLGHQSPASPEAMAPISRNWNGTIRGNMALASTYALIFGEVGFRLLRCTLAVLLGFVGWALGSRHERRVAGGLLGLAFFALNPYVVMIQVLDTNVMAFAFGAFLMVLADCLDAGPITLGVVAGFTVGLGMNLLPLVFLIPLSAHILMNRRRRWLDLSLFLATALPVASIWLAYVTEMMTESWVQPFTYDFLGFQIKTNRLMVFPFGDGITRGAMDPFPSFIHYPMHVVHTLGVLVVAAALVGLWRTWKTSRSRALILALWGAPTYAALSLQAVLVEDDQMRIILTGMAPLFLLALTGVVYAWDNRARWPRFLTVAAALAVICFAASFLNFPVDRRIRDARWMVYQGGVENIDHPELLDGQPMYDLDGAEGKRRRKIYRIPKLIPNYFDVLPSSRSRGRHHFGRWSDFTNRGFAPGS
ncbi:MAG: hypothetical protein GXP54_09440 [Deltaproteobacteria bacterium]|nr:hypothetical protein [Deltaproteobacteria bacterium]